MSVPVPNQGQLTSRAHYPSFMGSESVGIGGGNYTCSQMCWGIICSGAGNVSLGFSDGSSDSIALSANIIYPVMFTTVFNNSTATGIHALH
jgi:hypothetical protein